MIEFSKTKADTKGVQYQANICVVGVGGAGSSVLDRIAMDDLVDADLISMNSDARLMRASAALRKLQLGRQVTHGLGAGGDPDVGFEAAHKSESEISEVLADRDMVFICTGLGGGTGSGAAPYIAEVAKRSGAFVVVFATMPFPFEGRRRIKQAKEALERVKKNCHALIVFENQRMGQLVLPTDDITKAFQAADLLIGQSIRAVATLVRQPGMIRIGMDDLRTALRAQEARCLFGFGEARGENRAKEALQRALQSPLLTPVELLRHSTNILVHIAGGESLTLSEVEALMNEVENLIPGDAHILFGAGVDGKLGDRLTVTLISSVNAVTMAEADALPDLLTPVTSHRQSPPAQPSPLRQVVSPTETPVVTRKAPPPPPPPVEPEWEEEEEVEAELPPPPPPKPGRRRPEPEPESDEDFIPGLDLGYQSNPVRPPARKTREPARKEYTEEELSGDREAETPTQPVEIPVESPIVRLRAPVEDDEPPRAELSPSQPVEDPDWDTADDSGPDEEITYEAPPPVVRTREKDQIFDAKPPRFSEAPETIIDGEDLDVPTYLRMRGK
jgi:cell division protein FtsZ